MHVLFLAPETSVYNLRFVEALKRAGARVSAIGHVARDRLAPSLSAQLERFTSARSLFDDAELLQLARAIERECAIDRIETIDEPLVGSAAQLRAVLGVPGVTPDQAVLCRDKVAMKDALRRHALPCAASTAAADRDAVIAFAEREGYPIVLKPRHGFGTLDTFRVDSQAELERVLERLKPAHDRALVVEEFVDGHEGFHDTITVAGRIAHDFIGHYYPTCLAALQDRAISPQIACTNRVASPGYQELRDAGQKVIDALGLRDCATHMEWFFGAKGLKISEIAARPAGERIWDMHAAGNEFDVYGAWAAAILGGKSSGTPTRKFATGSVQIRPDRDGRYVGHAGVEHVQRLFGDDMIESSIPAPGAPTQPLDKGWHVNTWFRLRDPDYDRLRERLEFIGRTVKARAG